MDKKAYFHLPGLFEFYEFYRIFLPLFFEHRDYFYDWCEIGSIYGAPSDCIWGGGRVGFGDADEKAVLSLMKAYGISSRLTFSNSLLQEEHLTDAKCNRICKLFEDEMKSHRESNCEFVAESKSQLNIESNIGVGEKEEKQETIRNGVIVHSDLLCSYLQEHFPKLLLISSTTKVLVQFEEFRKELKRKSFRYVVPDFRLNKAFDQLKTLSDEEKDKVEFLCNECCWSGCKERKNCYEHVSRKNLGLTLEDFPCHSKEANLGYRFSAAMEKPEFIGIEEIQNIYIPMGFSNFKIEGRGLGSALLLEFILYYMTKPECQLKVREEIYLDNMLDLF